jgi:hypothetical protein
MRYALAILAALLLPGCAARLAQQDDSYCRSLGAQKGSAAYVQCRTARDEQYQRQIAEALKPNTLSCTTYGNRTSCTEF